MHSHYLSHGKQRPGSAVVRRYPIHSNTLWRRPPQAPIRAATATSLLSSEDDEHVYDHTASSMTLANLRVLAHQELTINAMVQRVLPKAAYQGKRHSTGGYLGKVRRRTKLPYWS